VIDNRGRDNEYRVQRERVCLGTGEEAVALKSRLPLDTRLVEELSVLGPRSSLPAIVILARKRKGPVSNCGGTLARSLGIGEPESSAENGRTSHEKSLGA
jgi:hypothetical protein